MMQIVNSVIKFEDAVCVTFLPNYSVLLVCVSKLELCLVEFHHVTWLCPLHTG